MISYMQLYSTSQHPCRVATVESVLQKNLPSASAALLSFLSSKFQKYFTTPTGNPVGGLTRKKRGQPNRSVMTSYCNMITYREASQLFTKTSVYTETLYIHEKTSGH